MHQRRSTRKSTRKMAAVVEEDGENSDWTAGKVRSDRLFAGYFLFWNWELMRLN
jgi:hypothetical protein